MMIHREIVKALRKKYKVNSQWDLEKDPITGYQAHIKITNNYTGEVILDSYYENFVEEEKIVWGAIKRREFTKKQRHIIWGEE